MALSLNANWLREFRRENVQPVFLVKIYTGVSTIYTASSGPLAFDNTYPTVVQNVEPYAYAVDVLTREPVINESTIEFQGSNTSGKSWARNLVVNKRLRGKKCVVLWGTPNLSEADFEEFFQGVIDQVKVKDDHSVQLVVKNGLQMVKDTQIIGSWINLHPLEVITDILDRANVPSELIDATTLDPTLYTDFSHFVLWRGNYICISEYTSAFDLLNEVSQHMDGCFVDGEDGKLRFVNFDSSKATTQDWTEDDFWALSQETLQGNIITGFNINFMHAGYYVNDTDFPKCLYRVEDTDALDNWAYPGLADAQKVTRDYTSQWLNGTGRGQDSDASWNGGTTYGGSMTDTVPGVGDFIRVAAYRSSAFCGTRWVGFPAGSEGATYQVNGTNRTVFWQIGDEIVEMDQVTVSTSSTASLTSLDWQNDPDSQVIVPLVITGRVKTRGALGTVAAGHRIYNSVYNADDPEEPIYDVTVAVKMMRTRLARFSNGCPIVKVKTRLDKFAVQVGDLVSLTTTRYAAYGSDGLTTTTKWEVVSKEIDINSGCILWTLAWATGPTAATPTENHRFNNINRRKSHPGASFSLEVSRDSLVWKVSSGLTVSVVSGLQIQVAKGLASCGSDTAQLAQNATLTLAASRDHYIFLDCAADSIGTYSVPTGDPIPSLGVNCLILAKAAAGVSTVTLTAYGSNFVEFVRSSAIGTTPMKAKAITTAKVDDNAVTPQKIIDKDSFSMSGVRNAFFQHITRG